MSITERQGQRVMGIMEPATRSADGRQKQEKTARGHPRSLKVTQGRTAWGSPPPTPRKRFPWKQTRAQTSILSDIYFT